MLALSKPLSSPGRAEKFPPPLLRFLTSTNTGGSTSRGRSRMTTAFYIRSRRHGAVVETAQEPSSPKVTCIGQVRARRSGKSGTGTANRRRRRRCCWWVRKVTVFCGRLISWRRRRWYCTRVFCKSWGFFFGSGYCKKVDHREDSFRVCNSSSKQENGRNEEQLGGGGDRFAVAPPKHALLLTRCRSAPYRSSSLGGRFWSSPLSDNGGRESDDGRKTEAESHESDQQPRNVDDSRISTDRRQELENPEKIIVAQGIAGKSLRRLTRCKSEPARTGERLDPNPNPNPNPKAVDWWWSQNS